MRSFGRGRSAVMLGVLASVSGWAVPPESAAASPPTPLSLRYVANIHGFRALAIEVDVATTGTTYDVTFHDHTVGWVGAMIDTHIASEASGRFVGEGVQPARYASAGHSRGADRRVVITYAGDVPHVDVLSPVETRRDPVPAAETVGTIDPLSALVMLLREVSRTGQCAARFRVFDGARLTTVQAWTAGRAVVPRDDESPYAGDATECAFRTQEVGGFLHDAAFARSHEPQGGHAWLAPVGPGGALLPIRARFSTVEHGEITLFLTAAGAGGDPTGSNQQR